MGTGRLSWVPRGVLGWEAGLLLIGLVASLIPVEAKTRQFWGTFPSWKSTAPDRITIDLVDSISPLGAAGLKDGDQVIAIDGKPFTGKGADIMDSWYATFESLHAGQEAKILVKRDDKERTIIAKGIDPQTVGKMYYFWQIAFAAGCAAFLISLLTTQSLPPRATIWRPMMLIMVGLGVAGVLLLADLQGRYMMFTSTEVIATHTTIWIQKDVCIAVTIVVVALAAWELRSTVAQAGRIHEYGMTNVPATL
jgi:hypothetical protein